MITDIRLDTNIKRQAKSIIEIGIRYYYDEDRYKVDQEPFRRDILVEKEDKKEMTTEEKKDYNHIYNQLCEAREIICKMLSSYKDKKEIDYSTIKRGEGLLKKDIFK